VKRSSAKTLTVSHVSIRRIEGEYDLYTEIFYRGYFLFTIQSMGPINAWRDNAFKGLGGMRLIYTGHGGMVAMGAYAILFTKWTSIL
jgi:hypothetical protein